MRLAALLALSLAGPAAAEPRPVIVLEDPAGDATGPGTYQPPGDPQFQEGDFDLRRLTVMLDGEDVVFEVTLGAVVRLPSSPWRDNRTPVSFLNGIYLQNVDVYVDTGREPGGVARGLPGRRIAFAGQRTWEAAVVLTPQPGVVRDVIRGALGAQAARVHVVEGVLSRGRTLVTRVPASALGGVPQPHWGYSVHVSGALWSQSFEGEDRLFGTREPNALTMPVTTVREAFAFGGAPSNSRAHPRVVDVLLPPGVPQEKVLGSFDAKGETFARVPFVYADGSDPFVLEGPAAGAPAPGGGPAPDTVGRLLPDRLRPRPSAAGAGSREGWTITDMAGDLVTIAGPTAGLAPLRIGRVVDADGNEVAQLVVGRVLEQGITASVVQGRDRVVRGATVRFDPP